MIFGPILVLARPKKSGLGTHWGVQFPDGNVYDYVAGLDLRVTTIQGFADGERVSIVRRIPWHMAPAVRARLQEISRNPRKYDLLEWNCESFANWLVAGIPTSAQVVGAVAVVALAALIALR
jgi:hypothetical protein